LYRHKIYGNIVTILEFPEKDEFFFKSLDK